MIKEKIKKIIEGAYNAHISEYSAQCAYFIILSFIPFVILLLTLIKYLGLDQQSLYNIIATIIPNDINNKVLDIVQEVYSKSIGTISISIIFIIWSAGKGFFALCKGLNSMYKVPKKYNYFLLRLRAIACTIGLLLMIIIALIFLVFGNRINVFINEHYSNLARVTNVILQFSDFIIFIILFIILLLIYKFIPGHKVKLKNQIVGALFTSIGWFIISYIFSIYLDTFAGFSVMYGSLTTVMLLFIWIYLCIYIVLTGAAINKYLERNGSKNEKTD